MKFERLYIMYMAVILVILCVLGALIAGASRPLTEEEASAAEAVYAATDFSLPVVSPIHRENGIIQWKDPGMEAHIRFILGKPTGDIYRSDVWNVQILSIQTAFQTKMDVLLETLPDGEEYFTRANSLNNPNTYRHIGNQKFPQIETLEDLSNFESLQVFSLNQQREKQAALDLSGIECCPYLNVIQISRTDIDALLPLQGMKNLHMLFLQDCGKVDLRPLNTLPQLEVLSLIGCEVSDLGILKTLPELRYLNLLDTVLPQGTAAPELPEAVLYIH